MTLNDIIFGDSLPKLDIHGYDRDTARIAIDDYVKENLKQKIEIFTIVHGSGSGILRTITQETLKRNKQVIEYKLNNYNNGCTMVRIKI